MGLVFRCFSRLPLALLHALGAILGWIVYLASATYRRRFKANVAQAGIAWPAARPAIAAAGRMAAELPWLWIAQKGRPLGDKLQWDGGERIAQALAEKRGLVMLTPHMGCFEICAQAIAERFTTPEAPITVLYRPARQASLRDVMAGSRERPGLATAPASLAGVRQMIRALRRGEVIGLLPDQVPPDGERLPGGQGFVVHVLPAPTIPADASNEAAAALVNAAMEGLIRRAPGQYLWGYHRYKAPRGLDIGAAP
jgi:KDO2-lipid IV(A) lauroyltransferase